MHPEIARFPSQCFYEGRLLTASTVLTRPVSKWQQEQQLQEQKQEQQQQEQEQWQKKKKRKSRLCLPYCFFHVRGGEVGGRGQSYHNTAEAVVVLQIASQLLVLSGLSTHQILIITFYAAQVACIKV